MSRAETKFGTGDPETTQRPEKGEPTLEEREIHEKNKEIAKKRGEEHEKGECSKNPIEHIKHLSRHLYTGEKFLFILMGVISFCYLVYIILSTTGVVDQPGIWPNIPYRRPCPNYTTDNVSGMKPKG